ncbi:hypothetical protein P170DRAFT_372249 [Aspergillus steynii IBT 23096]|uniref:Fungal N-terminal domain-containing protein n=1 Tax=Aspergillus steynii IBT 23096 TaxID=1392250 RepID=A0A2I2GSN3_9EURO|nr:uncharacterized protein P170DRAFT_372249 [Aspergillus steynii IBT 23096]PLB55883.1 hypothetical protein P170DRAFT_372249 [Aspergillus steynii IBT 23096]
MGVYEFNHILPKHRSNMTSDFAAGDIVTLTKTAWDLYHSCYLVARDAPDGFRKLVDELASLQGALCSLRDDVLSSATFFEDLGDDRKRTLQRCLAGCFQTLQHLKDLVTRYRNMGVGDGTQFWQKVKWATQRGQIEELKSKIMVHTCNLSLCMSSIGNSSLERIEKSMTDALEQDRFLSVSGSSPPEEEQFSLSTPAQHDAIYSEEESETDLPVISYTISAPPSTPANRPRTISSGSLTSTLSDGSGFTGPGESQLVQSIKKPLSRSTTERSSGFSFSTQDTCLFEARALDHESMELYPAVRDPFVSEIYESYESSPTKDPDQTAVMNAVTSAMQQLQQIRLRDQLHRPLRYEPRDKFHQPDAELIRKFDYLTNVRRLNTNDWLRLAVWWLLKARTTLTNCEKPCLTNSRGSVSPSIESGTANSQAYVDLLKASYILYDIVLEDEASQAVLSDENRKLISDLSEGIKDEFSQFTSVDIPEYSAIHSQNLDIWEPLQPEEEPGNYTPLGLENVRWISVDQEDAGNEEERVLFRTFVNAGIGSKRLRMRTKGAPYMLLLSTRNGESEPKITLCNQSGTLCLQRDFTPEDVAQLVQITQASISVPGAKISEPIILRFGAQSVSISFQYMADLMQFIGVPRAYFDAVWQREPVDSAEFSETVVFKSSLELFEQLKATTMKSMNPPMVHGSCEVRILERSFGEAWRSMRRMVISSSAAEKNPRCMEIFMPMSQVQVCREQDSRQVLIKWSDTRQERSSKTDGNYHPIFSYIYDHNNPNIGLSLHFRTQQQAEEFERVVLSLSLKPAFWWTQSGNPGQVYDVTDHNLDQKQYKAISVLHTRLSWKYINLYYLYRDADYVYEHSSLRVHFPRVFYTDYISSHVDKLYPADHPVFFSHCEKKIGNFTVVFKEEQALRGFMTSLASAYELAFSRRAVSLTTKGKSMFGTSKSSKGETEVQLWRKGSTVQFASRWKDLNNDQWLTMSVPSGVRLSSDHNRVDFPAVIYSRGAVLNMATIMAGAPKHSNKLRKTGPITVNFPTAKDREEFVKILTSMS